MRKTLLLYLLVLSAIANAQSNAEIYIEQGKSFYDAEEYDKAEAKLEEAVQLFPKNYTIIKMLADSKHKQGQFNSAIKLYDKAESIKSDDQELFFNRGAAYVFVDKFRQANKDFDRSIDLGNMSPKIYYYKGFVNASQDKYKSAIESYNIAIKLNPDYAEAYYNRGAAKAELKNYTEGMKDFELALEKDPNLENGRINIALSKLGQKRYMDAIKDFDEIIAQRNTNMARALYYRGEAYYELKEKEKACEDWQRASNLKHDQATANLSNFCGSKVKPRKDINIVF